jgi:anaerobic dimethyl sulfoxide reductase subunit C (anchor subunit)
MKEWPLILFTLATQLSCGLALAAAVFEWRSSAVDVEPMRPLAIAIFPVAALGILFSMAHLGRPRLSWRAVLNLGQSRLSAEVVLTTVFALLALAYSGFWWLGKTEGRLVLGAALSAVGIAAVLAAAAVYMVPTRPVWNSGWVPLSFLGTTLLLGALAPALLLSWKANTGLLRVFLGAAAAGSLLLFIAACWMVANLSRRADDPFTAMRLAALFRSLTSKNSLWLGCHLVFAILLPAAVAFRLWPRESVETTAFAPMVLALVIFGTAIGRALMFWLGASYEPF